MAPVTRLTAVVPPQVCAAALGRAWPQGIDAQVRGIDEGSRALELAWCCAPTPDEVADADAVTAGLVATPGALPVLGVVRGPLAVSAMHGLAGSADDLEDRLDDASDAAVDRIRALSDCGVRRIAIVEDGGPPPVGDDDAAESHRPLLNAAAHLRIDLVFVAGGLDGVESLGYGQWASDRGCSPGLGFLPAEAFDSAAALERWLDRARAAAGDSGEVLTALLDAGVSPDVVRHGSRALAQVVVRP